MKKHWILVGLLGLSLPVTTVLGAEDDPSQDQGFLDDLGDSFSNMGTVTVIMAKYAKDPVLGFFQLQVYAEGDQIALKGEVDTDQQFERAVMLALNTKDVTTVDASGIMIKNNEHPVEVLLLNAKVQSALYEAGVVDNEDPASWPFQVESSKGIVHLKGDLTQVADQDALIEMIEGIEGVESVELDVANQEPIQLEE